MPEVRRIKIDIPKESVLSKYEEQLKAMIINDEDKDTIALRRQVFNNCLSFLKNELKTEDFPLVRLVFVNSTSEYDALGKQTGKYTREKVKTLSLAFITPSLHFGVTIFTIYLNMEQFFGFLRESTKTFVYHLVQIYIHELLHCFYGVSKNEQEIHNVECEMLEKFSGLTLPDEIKQLKISEFYQNNEKTQR